MAEFHVSPDGRVYIETKEGCKLRAYQANIRGHLDVPTIGFGHTGPDVHLGLVWTQEQADEALTARLATEFEPCVNRVCRDVPTTQGQFDAMVALAYNIGIGAFAQSSVARFHRANEYDKAADAFEHYDHYHGEVNEALHQRRVEEGQRYMDASPVRPPAIKEEEPAEDADGPYIHGGVVYTPQGSDPVGYGKLAAPGVTTPAAVILAGWTRWKYGIELSAEMAASVVGLIILALVYVIPHGRK